MWNQSKKILWLLLFFYVPQVIITCIVTGVYNTSKYVSGTSQITFMCRSNLTQVSFHLLPSFSPVTKVQVMDISVCNLSWSNTPHIAEVYNDIPRFVLSAALLILAVTQTVKQSLDMYRATKQWQPNQYMERLVRDGIIYFLVYVSLPLSRFYWSPSLSSSTRSSICRHTNHLLVFS